MSKKHFYASVMLLLIGAILAACNLPASDATQTPLSADAAFTAVAQTVEAQFTIAAQTQSAAPAATNTTAPTITPPPPLTTPTSTIAPVVILPTSTLGCDQAQFVTDVTVPDGTNYSAGDTFTKTWRIKNTGTCSWTSSYTLFFTSGNQMNGPSSIPLSGNVNPGETVDISINLTAPATAGEYTGFWKLRNTSGVAFTSMYAKINVGGTVGGEFRVIHATLSSAGECGDFDVTAKIETNAAGTVTYNWVRSDSATSSTETLVFSEAGAHSVTYNWDTTASGEHWIDIYIDEPNHQQFGRAEFECP